MRNEKVHIFAFKFWTILTQLQQFYAIAKQVTGFRAINSIKYEKENVQC